MEPYNNYGNLPPITGVQEERVDLDQTMEMSCNLNSIISQVMDIPAMSPPPTASKSLVTSVLKDIPAMSPPPTASKSLVTSVLKTSRCGPLPATTACSQGDKDIHPSHVKKKGLEAVTEIDISRLTTETVSRVQECKANYVHSAEIEQKPNLLEVSEIPPITNVNPSTHNTIEGVGLVVDPALTNLPPELRKVDKVIIICNKDNLDTVLNRDGQKIEMTSVVNSTFIQPQKPDSIQPMEYGPLQAEPAAFKPLQEPSISQSYLEEVRTPDSFIEVMEGATNEVEASFHDGNIEFVYSEQMNVPGQQMMIKEEPAESFTVDEIKQLLGTSSSFPQDIVTTEAAQTPRVCVDIPWISHEEIKTPHDFLGNDGSFDLLQYITKDDLNEVPPVPQPSAANENPFQFPTVTADVEVVQPVKRKMNDEPSISKKKKIQVTIKTESRKPAQKTAAKPRATKSRSQDKYDETRRKNNIASKRSRDNRRQKQLDNDKLLVELTETNEKLTKKHESLTKLVQTMQDLLFKSMGR